MDDICRLCCSSSFVTNHIFDEENALYIKMSLYLPIKVFRDDRLPQKVCDKCSCKVNDFYQFCNETIEVQDRLRAVLVSRGFDPQEVKDCMRIKENVSPIPVEKKLDQTTQTGSDLLETINSKESPISNVFKQSEPSFDDKIKIKEEPRQLSPVKEECMDDFDNGAFSDDSDDMSLITFKKKKKKKEVNGIKKRTQKKKKLKDLESILNGLPEAKLTDIIRPDVKQELEQKPQMEVSLDIKAVKNEPIEGDVFNCCICFQQCLSRGEMLQHYRGHSLPMDPVVAPAAPPPPDVTPLRCTRCRKSVTRAEWAAHWTRHWERDRRPFRCALCEKSFRDPHQILKHGQTHKFGSGEDAEPLQKRFVCDLCPEAFVYMRYLLAHRTQAHPDALSRALVLRCNVCARQFAHLNSLRRHLRAHSGERNYLCNVCGKALSSREHLKFHIRIHTGYKPNVCKTCGKGFVKKCNLTLHERVHSGEKPHVCSHCGKAFSQRSTLVIHERYHSGARPYACALCHRGFVAKGLLSMHLKSTCIW